VSRAAGEIGPPRILLLGGTGEAKRLAEILTDRGEIEVVTSLAGRTAQPSLPPGEIRNGGFGGADGLAAYLAELRPVAVVDATHPYAEQISRNARRACAALGVPRLRLERAAWKPQEGDDWRMSDGLADAVDLATSLGKRVFLAVGRVAPELPASYPDHFFLIRSVEPLAAQPENARCLTRRGPFRRDDELELLDGHRIHVVVSKASGGSSVFAKIEAARELGLPVVMLRRPDPPAGPLVNRIDEALTWLSYLLEDRAAGRSTWV
jgi:precorrin-6A/cobalt-precorrin-6A reductase